MATEIQPARLGLAVCGWALSIPVMAITGSWLKRTAFPSVSAEILMAHVIEAVLVLLAAYIYWRFVPATQNWGRRLAYLVVFVIVLGAIGYLALGASIVVVTLLFGL